MECNVVELGYMKPRRGILEQDEVLAKDNEGGRSPQRFKVEPVKVRSDGELVLSPPMRGSDWVAVNGPSNFSNHRRTVVIIDGRTYVPERFAIDWVQVGKNGATYNGDSSKNESYLCSGRDIIAVADGRVARVLDGVPENVPNQAAAVTINLENIGGNHVVQELVDGRYAFYAHMIPRSLRVKPGDFIKRGQVIGRIGNSGNSDEPHLHFHVMISLHPMASDGLPFLLTKWTRQEYKLICPPSQPNCNFMSGPVKLHLGATHKAVNEIVLEDELGDFNQP
jgi:Peptidase family M23